MAGGSWPSSGRAAGDGGGEADGLGQRATAPADIAQRHRPSCLPHEGLHDPLIPAERLARPQAARLGPLDLERHPLRSLRCPFDEVEDGSQLALVGEFGDRQHRPPELDRAQVVILFQLGRPNLGFRQLLQELGGRCGGAAWGSSPLLPFREQPVGEEHEQLSLPCA